MPSSFTEKICRNCKASLKEDDRFCHECGQKYRIKKPTLWMILGEFTSSLFSWDSTVYRSFRTIFIPGKLTNAFIEGRIKSYAPPIRVFIVSSFFLIAAISAYNNSEEERQLTNDYVYNLYRNATISEIQKAKSAMKTNYPDSITNIILDRLIEELQPDENWESTISVLESSDDENDDWSFSTSKEIPMLDVLQLSEDSLFNKYQIEGTLPQLIARQQIKNTLDNDGFVNFFLNQITIQALLMMPVVALILKFLYWRRAQFFVDHFVFSLHYHSFAFIVLGGIFLICYVTDFDPALSILLGVGIISVYLFIAMKQVYQQTVGKTLLKYILLNVIYLFILTFFLVLSILVGFLIF